MESVIEILSKGSAWLAKRGVANPRLQAEWILADALGCRRLDLYLRSGDPVVDPVLGRVREAVRRRGSREPLQYILGSVEFHGIRLKVDPRALIPRPETEEMVELVLRRLDGCAPSRVLDLGTGSGAIALALATRWAEARVVAIDSSAAAVDLARENAQSLGLGDRVEVREGTWSAPLDGPYDLIVSNPPYLTEEEWQTAEPEVRESEPRVALVAGEDGLADLLAILGQAAVALTPGGMLALETGVAHHERLAAEARALGFSQFEGRADLSRRPRFFLAWK